MILQRATFELPSSDDVFIGYFDEKENWNGWRCPYMTKEQVQTIADKLGDTDISFEEDGTLTFEGEKQIPAEILTTDGELPLYSVGYGWCWSLLSKF